MLSTKQITTRIALNRSFARSIGIDLGTTNSCVASMESGKPVVIANSEGGRITPSIVAYSDQGTLVGLEARRQSLTNPENTFYATKRLIGRKYDDAALQDASLSYKLVSSPSGEAWIDCPTLGKAVSPAEVGAQVLQRMKMTAEEHYGETITDAVVTVPAYFNDSQRSATQLAGKLAGLNVQRIVNEPTAASLLYNYQTDEIKDDEIFAVFDLGGGTFDVSVMECSGGVFSVLATNGDTRLGGEDWDQLLIRILSEEFRDVHGWDPRSDVTSLQRLREASEQAKIELSRKKAADINLPFLWFDKGKPVHLTRTVSRAEFESQARSLTDRLTKPCKSALRDAGITQRDLSRVILVGGMSRVPSVQATVADVFGQPGASRVNPDEAVALGAAVQAAVLNKEVDSVLLLDVTPLSLGIETLGGVFTPLIPRNTTIPVKKGQSFSTAADNQTCVKIKVYQGERELAAQNHMLGEFELSGIPPSPRGVPKIEVSFEIDENGIVGVTARDEATHRQQAITVTSGGLSDDELDRMVADAEANREADKLQKEKIELRNEVDTLSYSLANALTEHSALLKPAMKVKVEAGVEESRTLAADADADAIRSCRDRLNALSLEMGRSIYEST